MKLRQKKTMCNKVEHVYLEVKIDQFYFSKEIPCATMDSLFGRNMEKFNGDDQVNNMRSSSHRRCVNTYHIYSRDRLKEIISTSDVDFYLLHPTIQAGWVLKEPFGIFSTPIAKLSF